MTDPLSSIRNTFLRAQRSSGAASQEIKSSGVAAGPPATANPSARVLQPVQAERMATRLRERVLAHSAQYGAGPGAAIGLNWVVEEALLAEFGDSLQLDPAFSDWVEKTCLAMNEVQKTATFKSAMAFIGLNDMAFDA